MKKGKSFRKVIGTVSNFFVFFLLAAFVTTCCILLFISALQGSIGRKFTQDEITLAAKITMVNVILISIAMAALDHFRRKFAVERPVAKITEATSKMIEGDFSVRIEPISKLGADDSFNEIIECINKMAEELSGVETLRADFIANVSHEMKTPLSVIQNYGTLLQAPDLSEEKRVEYAKAITDASRRLADMMTNVLKLNRLENQQIYPKLDVFDLGEQLCESLLQFEDVWERKGLQIETDIEESGIGDQHEGIFSESAAQAQRYLICEGYGLIDDYSMMIPWDVNREYQCCYATRWAAIPSSRLAASRCCGLVWRVLHSSTRVSRLAMRLPRSMCPRKDAEMPTCSASSSWVRDSFRRRVRTRRPKSL